jgi:signal transduction histidine kinase
MQPPVSVAPVRNGDRRLILLAAAAAVAYHSLLFALDEWAFPWPPLPWSYYVLNSGAAALVLVLAGWQPVADRLGRALLPVVISLMALAPILSTYLLSDADRAARPLGLAFAAVGTALRIAPVLLLGLVLAAWYYRWLVVALYSLACAAVQIAALVLFATPGLPLIAGGSPFASSIAVQILVIIPETTAFLITGYFVSTPMSRLRAQQAALDTANSQLRRAAGALEGLTISRERNRLARELHDTLAHTLSGLSVQLETVNAYWDVDPGEARTQLGAAQETARLGLQETRQALTALRASPLEDLGLGLALRQLAEAAAARADLALDLDLPNPLPPFAPEVEQGLYRVAQEALANVVYHARARHLTVALAGAPSTTRLVIRDDGVGFDPAVPITPGHFGLAGIRERAQLIGGLLNVTSRPGSGTTVELSIPGS